ncbi:MAG: 30S ribosomal protein S20 [Bacteroidia bacterium]|nr:30S ribosomal protein S20 [Bacteroidia bacterium]MCX7652460.1 30S ribosomal protein S20 [Bacteroidia bacterium]MDW8416862.1 30S ribosomal protein S20 [Bacteroidia bacterium]
MAAPAKKKKTARSKTALKRHRKALRRRQRNLLWKAQYRQALRALRNENELSKLPELLRKVHSVLDRMGRRNIFHRNKVGRLKSRLAQYVAKRLAGNPSV